jgi:hypothetical protein
MSRTSFLCTFTERFKNKKTSPKILERIASNPASNKMQTLNTYMQTDTKTEFVLAHIINGT